jgi:hypothetical protein
MPSNKKWKTISTSEGTGNVPNPVPPLQQFISWPGVFGVESFVYVVNHGISPDVAVMTTIPQPNQATPAEFGDLVFSDGQRFITLRDCKVSRITGRTDSSGTSWTLEILDRRWRWDGLNALFGEFNQLDNRAKLVPWTIRSPTELATVCLDAMGETNYIINLPPGLPKSAGQDINKYLSLGDNFPQTGTNPPTVWNGAPPSQLLAQLADLYGCHVIWQPIADRVIVTPIGQGEALPDGPCESITPAVKAPVVPASVGLIGAPLRIQMRLGLEAVGEEWSGQYVPIDELSYRPQIPGKVQISTATFTGTGNPELDILIVVHKFLPNQYDNTFIGTGGSIAVKLSGLAAKINADEAISAVITASATATVLTLTGKNQGEVFDVIAVSPDIDPPDTFIGAVTQIAAGRGKNSWAMSCPPDFPTVQAVGGRLSYSEALALAKRTVFKCYRIKDVDIFTNKAPINVPLYGAIKRRQQIVLQDTMCEQVVPGVRVAALQVDNPNIAPGFGIPPSFYNGYSRDRPSRITGTIATSIGQVLWTAGLAASPNTPDDQQVFLPFSINVFEQMVVFDEAVYKFVSLGGPTAFQFAPADLILETAVLIHDNNNNAIVRYLATLPLAGPKGQAPTGDPPGLAFGGSGTGGSWVVIDHIVPAGDRIVFPGELNQQPTVDPGDDKSNSVEWSRHDDVQPSIMGKYLNQGDVANLTGGDTDSTTVSNVPSGFTWLDKDDADRRANYYLANQAAKFRLTGGEIRQYIGTYPIDPDGAIQSVQWSFGSAGATTIAGRNSEFSHRIPDYPIRRRAENLQPWLLTVIANMAERQFFPGGSRAKPGT